MFVLSKLFGECPQVKIMEAFAKDPNDMLYVADIARMTNLSKITVNNYINKLFEENIVEKREKAGKIQYYQLNRENPKAKIILSLEEFIVSNELEDLIKTDAEKNVDSIKIETQISVHAGCQINNPNSEEVKTSSFQTPYVKTIYKADTNNLNGGTSDG